MEINYPETIRIIRIRMRQISDAALEHNRFCAEIQELEKIEKALAALIVLEREDTLVQSEVSATAINKVAEVELD